MFGHQILKHGENSLEITILGIFNFSKYLNQDLNLKKFKNMHVTFTILYIYPTT